jgi:hypothetical protein
LFYVSKNSHKSIELFKEYLLHLAFTTVDEDASSRKQVSSVFPFTQKAIITDRERIFIPLGWDSKAKIATLDEDFDFSAFFSDDIQEKREERVIKSFKALIGKPDAASMVLL